MSHHGNTELLETLYEHFLSKGYSEQEAAELAHQEFELQSL
tara:strand:+ start:363 stop:485 length:123 start_codon:yes stop_codon:yes gene_type:complete